MKKILVALPLVMFAGASSAAELTLGTSGTKASVIAQAAAGQHTLTTSGTTPLFVRNGFVFALSAGVAVGGVQTANAFGVSAGATKGRTVYTGQSNGGSVVQCGALTTAGDSATPDTLVETRLDQTLAAQNACVGAAAAPSTPASTSTGA